MKDFIAHIQTSTLYNHISPRNSLHPQLSHGTMSEVKSKPQKGNKMSELASLLKEVQEASKIKNPLDRVEALTKARQKAKRLEEKLVRDARMQGYSWRQIAEALGVAPQTVWHKYHKMRGMK